MTHTSHDSYFCTINPDARARLEAIQTRVELLLPLANRCISYNIPAYRQGRVFFYFAAFKKHVGIYPPLKANHQLIDELTPYRGAKGNLSFPLAEELPLDLIGRVAVALHHEYARV